MRAALRGLERLTYCAFRISKPLVENFQDTVQHPSALSEDEFDLRGAAALYPVVATLYRQWLAYEGRNTRTWLALAQRRARAILASKNLSAIYCAASFLALYRPYDDRFAETGRDDRPEETMARIHGLFADFQQSPASVYLWHGQALPIPMGNWRRLLTCYGPLVRRYASTLIRFQEESGLSDWGGLASLRNVGGEEIMAYLFACLPKELSLDSRREIQFGIDRWAGRCFAADSHRQAWWEGNRGTTQEALLREGLPIVAAQADRNELWSPAIAEELLADLPPPYVVRSNYKQHENWDTMMRPRARPVSRAAWVRDNQRHLIYDERVGTFRLDASSS